MRLRNDFIGVEHLLLGLIREGDGTAIKLLNEFHLDLLQIRNEIEQSLLRSSKPSISSMVNIPLVKQAEKVLKITYLMVGDI